MEAFFVAPILAGSIGLAFVMQKAMLAVLLSAMETHRRAQERHSDGVK